MHAMRLHLFLSDSRRTDGRGVVVGAVRIAATVSDRDLGA